MTSKMVTHKDSALSMKNKFTIVTQECFRMLLNTSESVDDEIKTEILNDFMKELKHSGYNEKDRETILVGGIKTYSNLKLLEKKGKRPFYRPRSFEKEKREREKVEKPRNWFK